jgi:hypothetical protein
MAAIWAAEALASQEEKKEVKVSIGRGPPPSGPCSTSMPPLVDEMMEILSEPHVQQIVEMAVANGTQLVLTPLDHPLSLDDVQWRPPKTDEQLRQEDVEAMDARRQAQRADNEIIGLYDGMYGYDSNLEDGYNVQIKKDTHFASGNPRPSTMFGRQPSPEGYDWNQLTKAEATRAKNKIAKHHRQRRKQGKPFKEAYPDDRRRPPTQQANELYNGVWAGELEERTVFYPTSPWNRDLITGYWIIVRRTDAVVRWVPPAEDGRQFQKCPPGVQRDVLEVQTEANVKEREEFLQWHASYYPMGPYKFTGSWPATIRSWLMDTREP